MTGLAIAAPVVLRANATEQISLLTEFIVNFRQFVVRREELLVKQLPCLKKIVHRINRLDFLVFSFVRSCKVFRQVIVSIGNF
jgi:hypothetical protein